jgi:NAD(P)H-quinone oxidoreductase subunit 5
MASPVPLGFAAPRPYSLGSPAALSMSASSRLPALLTRLMWGLFAVSVALCVALAGQAWPVGPAEAPWMELDGLAQVMAVVVTFVSGIVHSFSRRYMAGSKRIDAFYVRLFGLTLIVLLLTAANHLVLFGVLWTAMGWVLASLIGHIRGWPEAQASAQFARISFLAGSAALAAAIGIVITQTGQWTLSGAMAQVDAMDTSVVLVAAALVILAAAVQSALVPFHRWLLSSMTAPTPVSAFMHAGLVNAGGILLARFAPVVFDTQLMMLVVVALGGLTALAGQAWALVQTNVKRQLGCSTTAQMGFMVLQCGLGFIAAAVAHLILHGFYKAYLFLASGSVVEVTEPPPRRTQPTAPVGIGATFLSLATALGGGALFAWLTGKSITALDSGTFLTFFVVLAVLHAAHTLLQRASLPASARAWALPVAVLPALAMYAAVYNGVAWMMADVPMAVAPGELTVVHWILASVFLLAYIAIERGWHRSSTRLYVALLNSSQPVSSTLLTRRDRYHVH